MTGRATHFPPPRAFHVLAKPTGAICNLDCRYCYFLKKEALYPDSRFRMNDDVLDAYVRQTIESHSTDEVTLSWQGGEPTLIGLDFFRRAVALAERYRKPGMTVRHTIQTNGTRLNESWCQFFREHEFLVGLSLDGPRELHDRYRVDKRGRGTFDAVWRAAQLLREHGVAFNILATVHAGNAEHPLEVYRFFRDEVGAAFIQFIPIVERDNATGDNEGTALTDRSVTGEQYGAFLVAVFDEWLANDVGRVHVQIIEVTLGTFFGSASTLCIFSPTCGNSVALEHTGDLYSCDHFVEPRYLLGNITSEPMIDMVASPRQRSFGRSKLLSLPRYCRECDVLALCYGGCPKDRMATTPDGEPGLNVLCAGYKRFFRHVHLPMRQIVELRLSGRPASDVMRIQQFDDSAPLV
ncbi:MAG: anaerobic sulfatase maturase [Rhodospirillales bacterium]|nr:anaerobic sulfatase maturase [Rhodospirillales bacterium]